VFPAYSQVFSTIFMHEWKRFGYLTMADLFLP
jgi:hypothetical protein